MQGRKYTGSVQLRLDGKGPSQGISTDMGTAARVKRGKSPVLRRGKKKKRKNDK